MASRRIRIEDTRLKSWKEVDEALWLIGQTQMTIEAREAEMNARIDAIKAETAEAVRPLQEQIAAKELAIQQFVTENRESIGGKTKVLNFGKTGFRQSTRLIIRQEREVLKKLRDMGLQECIRVKETINREELKKKGDAIIQALGTVKKKVQDIFWYEVDRERIEGL